MGTHSYLTGAWPAAFFTTLLWPHCLIPLYHYATCLPYSLQPCCIPAWRLCLGEHGLPLFVCLAWWRLFMPALPLAIHHTIYLPLFSTSLGLGSTCTTTRWHLAWQRLTIWMVGLLFLPACLDFTFPGGLSVRSVHVSSCCLSLLRCMTYYTFCGLIPGLCWYV
jgi:hypothetical protein